MPPSAQKEYEEAEKALERQTEEIRPPGKRKNRRIEQLEQAKKELPGCRKGLGSFRRGS